MSEVNRSHVRIAVASIGLVATLWTGLVVLLTMRLCGC